MSTSSITKPGHTPRQRLAVLAALAVVPAVVAAGCGSGGPTTTSTGSAAAAAGGPAAAAFQYARCMRQHGVPNFPDPHVTTTAGSVRISMMAPASAGAAPAMKSADKACQGILPTPGNAGPSSGGPNKQDLLAFAHCLRSRGISGFPDPNAQGRLTLQMISGAGVDYRSRTFETAADSCVGVTHGAITPAKIHALVSGNH
jgi:hypothetical protein